MACASSPSKIPPKTGGRKPKQPLPSYFSVKKTAVNGKKTHGKAQNTTINYDGHICCGKEFLAAYSRDDQLSEARGESNSAANTDSDTPMDPKFPYAFTGPLSRTNTDW
ncbi:hypothetical protein BYT27DRAFT_7261528 [Phlegmacium glaucopus]|nr:hypothetical protein BYT27DRAFT_7261528 [Phlegmacium glaucopus]